MEQQTRNFLFKFICIPLRSLIIVLLVLFASNDTFRYVASGICFFLSLDFIRRYVQKRMVGRLFGGFAWWHPNRLKHAFLFLATGVLLLLEYEWAGFVLIADVLLGIYSYSFKETAKSIEQLDIPAF
jgi:hypothetical protein